MTWPRYLELCEYWQRVPPLAEVVAGFTGALGNTSEAPLPGDTDDAFAALARDLQMLGIG